MSANDTPTTNSVRDAAVNSSHATHRQTTTPDVRQTASYASMRRVMNRFA
jgi:hypothetical protein